jgi:hypothetical protein
MANKKIPFPKCIYNVPNTGTKTRAVYEIARWDATRVEVRIGRDVDGFPAVAAWIGKNDPNDNRNGTITDYTTGWIVAETTEDLEKTIKTALKDLERFTQKQRTLWTELFICTERVRTNV